MIIWALLLAALGFGLLVYSLLAGSVVWAWACIAACVAGGALLLVGALDWSRHRHRRSEVPRRPGPIQRPFLDEGTDLIRPPAAKEFRRPDRMDDNWR